MVRFLSVEWLDALDAVAVTIESTGTEPLTVSFSVDDFVYQLSTRNGRLRVAPGASATPDVAFAIDRDTAVAIARGSLSAQAAFMNGAVRIAGRTQALLANVGVLAELGRALAGVAEMTEF